jgi:hypothetical protein
MSQLQPATVQTIEPESVISYTLTNDTGRLKKTSVVSLTNANPIDVLGDRVRIHGDRIAIGKFYPFTYRGKRYLFCKPTKNKSEVYLVKG